MGLHTQFNNFRQQKEAVVTGRYWLVVQQEYYDREFVTVDTFITTNPCNYKNTEGAQFWYTVTPITLKNSL